MKGSEPDGIRVDDTRQATVISPGNRDLILQEDGLSGQFDQPFYKPIHSDPRWAEFLETVGSSLEQLAAIEFKVTLPH